MFVAGSFVELIEGGSWGEGSSLPFESHWFSPENWSEY